MDSKEFRERVARLEEVNEVVSKLDEAIRGEAFDLLRAYITDSGEETQDDGGDASKEPLGENGSGASDDEEKLVEEFESEDRADNAILALAVIYKRHGRGPFPLNLIATVGEELNLDLPDRIDMTFRDLKRDDKTLLRSAGKGQRKIGPGGEDWLKKTYGVRRGKKPFPASS